MIFDNISSHNTVWRHINSEGEGPGGAGGGLLSYAVYNSPGRQHGRHHTTGPPTAAGSVHTKRGVQVTSNRPRTIHKENIDMDG